MKRPAGSRKAAPLVEVMIASQKWRKQPRAAAIIRKAIRTAAVFGAKSASTPHAELAILLTNDSAMRALNCEWRKLDAPTNVLSFPAKMAQADRKLPCYLGDIAIAYETTAREAADQNKSFNHHLVHLAVHGYLHLLGYDHANDREAKKMERLEADILARLDIPDPYVPRDRTV